MKRLYRSRLTSVNPNAVGFVYVKYQALCLPFAFSFLKIEKVLGCLMPLLSPPQIPLFRITLFYGPEVLEGASETIHCVFNVKKRSWKGGVQVDIVVGRNQIQQLENQLKFRPWIDELLRVVPKEEREDFVQQGYDLWIQFLCFHKLGIYINQGIKQESTQVLAEQFIPEMNEVIRREVQNIKQQIMVELDLEAFETGVVEPSA